ncbi:2-succinyl-5-enolpyruvyl-6-hydroxy-3-cyclohexene-1-carboxylic-acid synthase [Crocinitomix algicola]|uniref:2-succinyl-5-enolpyruvyl-6-hydroxy-3- cyclohexene-1-carboxylic-acid synthase n=1 Tax=Crocinitomix algicola TaxID=1740263 RepID=UPI00082C2C1F|nr:2-succinyl-5-enolpyruvyl-6-hydroxy-3-cyclohexene-1-carboxylic-acid synthase [Crocinitomix algicola]
MKTTKISHIAHLAELCSQAGIRQIVLSPGSRNAPLVIAFDSHPEIETFVVHDERSASFFALGLAEASGKPVALACTSGSAPVNYGPGIVEAYYRQIPLLVLTADRPSQWIDQGDGQTIRQKKMFANFIKADFELPNQPNSEEVLISDKIVNQALNLLVNQPTGPVHINIPLNEPLYNTQDFIPNPVNELVLNNNLELNDEEVAFIRENYQKLEKKLVLIGQLNPSEIDISTLKPLLTDPSVAFLVENTSNIQDFENVCHCIDRTLSIINEDEIQKYQPDLLITLGGAIISKRIKAFLRKCKPQQNWRVGNFMIDEDTYASKTKSFKVNPKSFFKIFKNNNIVPTSTFGNLWKQADFLAEQRHIEFLNSVPFSDFKAFELIIDTLPEFANLHMGNSSVVRYCQLFNPIQSVKYYSNRGVSGIDGSSSTAAGFARNTLEQLNVVISGDISFFYDSNAWWNAYLSPNLRIILINNGGGGIFEIIDGPAKSDQSKSFIAPFEANAELLSKAFNLNYITASSENEMMNLFELFYSEFENKRPVVFEIKTKGLSNAKILKSYFSYIKDNQ